MQLKTSFKKTFFDWQTFYFDEKFIKKFLKTFEIVILSKVGNWNCLTRL
jgi:hypothetical protein